MSLPKTLAATAVVAFTLAMSPAHAAKPDNQRCGAAVGKSLSALNNSMNKEAARLCATQNDRPTEQRLTRAADRFNRKIDQAQTRFPGQCPTVGPVIAASVIDAVEDLATALCTPAGPDVTPAL